MVEKRKITPMPPEEIATLKAAIEKRWNEKPWYQGGDDPMGSPGCMMRAQEILSLIAAAEANASSKDNVTDEPDDGDEDACVVCGEHLEDGDPVYWSVNDDGHMHAECAKSYVDDDGRETDVPPEPFAFRSSSTPEPPMLGQEECAGLIDQMLSEPAYRDDPKTRLSLMIAARAIRRGRHLTAAEKRSNLKSFLAEGSDG